MSEIDELEEAAARLRKLNEIPYSELTESEKEQCRKDFKLVIKFNNLMEAIEEGLFEHTES